jgi:hypothetical protein
MPTHCPILGIPLAPSDAVLDHDHKTGHVRGVIHRQANALMGKIENFHRSFLSRLECGDLRTILCSMVDWIDADHSTKPLHPEALPKMVRAFGRKKAAEQCAFLESVGIRPAKTSLDRQKQAKAWLLTVETYQDKGDSIQSDSRPKN